MSSTETRGIHVQAECRYVEERSTPAEGYFFFSYRIRISNHGNETAQLLSRRWEITDGDGKIERVQGPGVVGEQPVLQPGTCFEYTSNCPLTTPIGAMSGSYELITSTGTRFEAQIPSFTLAAPNVVN